MKRLVIFGSNMSTGPCTDRISRFFSHQTRINCCVLITAVLVMLGLTACGGPAVDPATPPDIVYGEDVCDQCNMIINDARFAAGLVVETAPGNYEHRIFDDIGDLLVYARANADKLTIAAYYVHDFNREEWIDGERAYYVHSEEFFTPMGFGLAAVAQQLEAEALATEWDGTVLSLAEAQERFGSMDGMMGHGHQ